MRRAPNSLRASRAMTMIEILVALGILAIAIGSILSIFNAGARHGARAREKMEAGRVALAVFDLVDRGFTAGAARGRGAATPGSFVDNEIVRSDELAGTGAGWDNWRPAHVMESPVQLVWRYRIKSLDPATTDGVQLHRLSVMVAFDADYDLKFDDNLRFSDEPQPPPPLVEPEDRKIRTYEAILTDRRVTP